MNQWQVEIGYGRHGVFFAGRSWRRMAWCLWVATVASAGVISCGSPNESRESREAPQGDGKVVAIQSLMNASRRRLNWLKERQREDGSWGNDSSGRLLGFCLMVYRGHGETPASWDFGDSAMRAIERALAILEAQDVPDPILALGLAEAYSQNRIEQLREPVERAIHKIISRQGADGEFVHAGSDLLGIKRNNALWQAFNLMALEEAYSCGCDGSNAAGLMSAIKAGCIYLEKTFFSNEHRGFKLLPEDEVVSPLATAASAWALHCGLEYRSEAYDAAIAWVERRVEVGMEDDRDDYPMLTRYFVNRSIFSVSQGLRDVWRNWHRSYSGYLLDRQGDGGSVDLDVGPIPVDANDRKILSTALAALMHCVYYRYYPSFKVGPQERAISHDHGIILE